MTYLAALNDLLAGALFHLAFSAVSRTYWIYVFASVAIAVGLSFRHKQSATQLPNHLRSFARASWVSRSAINDYGLIMINALLIATVLRIFIPELPPLVTWWSDTLKRLWPHIGTGSAWWTPVLLAFCLFIADDFMRFLSHYLEHRLLWLWELHKVHHSAEVLNFFTADRHHPLSSIYYRVLFGMSVVLVNGIFLAFFANKISPAALMGGNIFWVASNLLGGTLRHSSVWLSFGPRVERWLISPAMHQIHHSTNEAHFDRNFGGTLAVWDRMCGTLYTTTSTREIITYGLGAETADYQSLSQLYLTPLRRICGSKWHIAAAGVCAVLCTVLALAALKPDPVEPAYKLSAAISQRRDVIAAILAHNQQPTNDMAARDRQWRHELDQPSAAPLIQRVMATPLARTLAQLRQTSHGEILQIMIMDRYGALVAADHITHDYDQSDEPKWQQTVGAQRTGPVHEGSTNLPDGTNDQVSQAVVDAQGQIIGAITLVRCRQPGRC
jgi:sterol desaturase/sphingolipid hydroxylase (fatty acid hydroxylase superfamily)